MLANDERNGSAAVEAARQALQTLQVQRQALETESSAITSELLAPPNDDGTGEPMGIKTPLVDEEGYPRGDVDVNRARTLRSRLACIQTDYKQLMTKIEQQLQELAYLQNPQRLEKEKAEEEARRAPKPKPKFDPVTQKWVVRNWDGSVAGGGSSNKNDDSKRSFDDLQAAQSTVPASSAATAVNDLSNQLADLRPFSRVTEVVDNSPAQEAGLQVGDLIVQFASINLDSNPNPLKAVGDLVPAAAGRQESVPVHVKRPVPNVPVEAAAAFRTLHLKPRPWAGRGLLGCHIVPYQGS